MAIGLDRVGRGGRRLASAAACQPDAHSAPLSRNGALRIVVARTRVTNLRVFMKPPENPAVVARRCASPPSGEFRHVTTTRTTEMHRLPFPTTTPRLLSNLEIGGEDWMLIRFRRNR